MANPTDVRDLVRAHLPGYRIDSITRLGAGLDNVAYEVNGELIVRVGREPRVRAEADLLAALAGISPLPVPEPAFVAAESGCLAYRKIPGVPLLDVPEPQRSEFGHTMAAALGGLLAALHAVPADRLTGLVEPDRFAPAEWLREAAESYPAVAEAVPAAHRAPIATFLNTAPPTDDRPLVFSHNDLGIEHVLVDPATGTVTGIIDWSDAAFVDPAHDFGLLHRDLGPAVLDAALRGYRTGDVAALRECAVFYARCSVFEDMAYGIETGRTTYLAKSVASMTWLFPG
ncbi:phosphotransferase family protein [Actinokineospora sp.]|uniref:phosphotransferase family protein n=1 Tax=Actinokineospora sp. TaxID=1872133 RepID=UPI00403828B1